METKLPSTVLPPESVDAPCEEENLSLEAFLNGTSGMSIREIAAQTGVTENLVKVRIHRAKEKLREILSQAGVTF